MNTADVMERFAPLRKTRRGWSARCPAHDDQQNSLSLAVGHDGRYLLHCFAGCRPEAVVRAVGLELRDLFPRAGGRRLAPTIECSPLDEARRAVQAEARRQPWARRGVLELYADTDSVHACYRTAAEARCVATKLGDCDVAWDLLAAAGDLERLAFAADAKLDQERFA